MKKAGVCAAGIFLIIIILGAAVLQPDRQSVQSWSAARAQHQLILDAGHGGEDGGAVSLSGVPESQINLAIVQKMDGILGLFGRPAILLRNEDRSLHDDTAVTLREKKVSDLKNRVDAVNRINNATLISIHQNSFPEQKYRGTQVFYANTDGSQELAAYIQNAIRQTIQPDNSREEKQITDQVYLMNNIQCRGVLVECGFLTNPEEEAKLRDADYQKKMVCVIGSCISRFQTM